jgi:hypothetical protein
MSFSAQSRPSPRLGTVLGGTLVGTSLVAIGLVMAYLAIATPLVASLAPTRPGAAGVSVGLGVWSFALIAGGSLLVAGTNRLAFALALVRHGGRTRGPAAEALSSSAEIVVVDGVNMPDGPPIAELAIGPFGVAVIHALASEKQVRQGPSGWERRASDGWQPMDDPLGAAMRDAERVRRWLATADLEFVVRVYAALVVDDRAIQRSPTCAVIRTDQIPGWVASLPVQRTLTAGRRGRLLAMTSRRKAQASGPRGSW